MTQALSMVCVTPKRSATLVPVGNRPYSYRRLRSWETLSLEL